MLGNFISASKYHWTKHALAKMRFYGLSEARVRRVINNPLRTEEGIAEKTVALMQPASFRTKNGKRDWNQEIWTMIAVVRGGKSGIWSGSAGWRMGVGRKLRVISAWRYPGKTKARESLPGNNGRNRGGGALGKFVFLGGRE